ncbi:DUF4041 domain-containing protein [Cellulomonas marina]|uniref:T5orf172 domain-containing protein n=1 Tax=Cellulomonas marina TaxID=988821 RepID=A0A1I1A5S3_9CELL|nr:DUF4041 domain-containing protein [Cellulomonas marina]GIG29574.1 hypothetical protein Cma02nite_21740 [Cellulomonas marina]SFB33257.1 T5orf172 domain-containing protein [Cellulomonas marina]
MTTQYGWNSPPTWPTPPPGWYPPEGWQPPPEWPPAPDGWQFWLPVNVPTPALPAPPTTVPAPHLVADASPALSEATRRAVPLFGARRKARELAGEADVLRAELARVGALDAVTLEEERRAAQDRLDNDVVAHKQARNALDRELADVRRQHEAEAARLEAERTALSAEISELRARVVELEETALLQEVGLYVYQHPLANAEAYKERLGSLRARIKQMGLKDGGAIEAATGWTVNGSAAEGRRMVSQTSNLMLRAYNGEADALVRGLKPHALVRSVERLEKTATAIEKLGRSMSIRIAPAYHRLRIQELELTADYVAKVAAEKEAERAAREALREQRKVEADIAREREKLAKEREHYLNALAAVRATGDAGAISRLEAQLADVDRAMDEVDYREANQRAGYVYVISNIGAFGESMIKVGMTRRLDPLDRVRELGDASVPFGFDVHALFFADDAVGIEYQMHQRLADRRVNRVNLRREFFYATPDEALVHLRDLAGDVLQYEAVPQALEYRQSRTMAGTAGPEPLMNPAEPPIMDRLP